MNDQQPQWPPQQYPQQPPTGYGSPQQPFSQQPQWNLPAPPQYSYTYQTQFSAPPLQNNIPSHQQYPQQPIIQYGQKQQAGQYQYRTPPIFIATRCLLALIFLGLTIFGLVLLFHMLFPLGSTPTDTLNTYCSALKVHDYQTAYNQFPNQNNQFKNENEFASAYGYADTVLGGLTDCTVSSINENDSSGIANGSIWLNYGDGTTNSLNGRLVNEGGSWKITSMT